MDPSNGMLSAFVVAKDAPPQDDTDPALVIVILNGAKRSEAE